MRIEVVVVLSSRILVISTKNSIFVVLIVCIMSEWPILKKPPVVVALFQLKFLQGDIDLARVDDVDVALRELFPSRMNNVSANINLPSTPYPLGASKFSGTTLLDSITYFTQDQSRKLNITKHDVTYSSEGQYKGWGVFKSEATNVLKILSSLLDQRVITRTSIRFINRFEMYSFEDPQEYFQTMVSATKSDVLPYPVAKYGFSVTMNVSDNAYSIVNQSLDKVNDKFVYLFDIDVLDRRNLLFETLEIGNVMESLREVKNQIFFGNVTEKTLELCN